MVDRADLDRWRDQVRDASDIYDIAGADTKLEASGGSWVGTSPLRAQERTPSFRVFPDGGWTDFGTNDSGDVFDYVQKRDRCDFPTAIKWLAERANIPNPLDGPSEHTEDYAAEINSMIERRNVQATATEIAEYMHACLPSRVRAQIREQYSFSDDTINRFKIGYDHGAVWDHFSEETNKPAETLLRTGFFLKTKDRPVDFFEHRIVFPYWLDGRCVYAIGRRSEYTSDAEHEKGKYKKLLTRTEKRPYISETVSNSYFYGEDSIKRRGDSVIITEGVTDCIAALASGKAAVSPVTTRFRSKDAPRVLELTKRFDKIVIINDEETPRIDPQGRERQPGWEGAMKMASELFLANRDVRIGRLPKPEGLDKVDLCDYLGGHTSEDLDKLIAEAATYPAILIGSIPKETDPGELSEALGEVYKVVASCPAEARDAYGNNIAKRFGLKRNTVANSIKEAWQARQATVQADAFDERSDPGRVRGELFEDEDRYYYVVTTDDNGKRNVEQLSTFTLAPLEKLIDLAGGDEQIRCRVDHQNGRPSVTRLFPITAWSNRRAFLTHLADSDAQWMGSDNHVQGVLKILAQLDIKSHMGTRSIGRHETDHGPRFVTADATYDSAGPIEDPEIKFVDRMKNNTMVRRLDLTDPGPEATKETMGKIAGLLFGLNASDVISQLAGWFSACPAKPAIMKITGRFPLLWVSGTQGSGKTTIVRDVFWPMAGVSSADPYSATGTNFSMLNDLNATSSVPIFIDEYRPSDMDRNKAEQLHRYARRLYTGDAETRGRQDQSVIEYHLSAPLVVVGEAAPDDGALRERIIAVAPNRNAITDARARALAAIRALPLTTIAVPYARFVMSLDIEAELEVAGSIVSSAVSGMKSEVSHRITHNLIVMVLGLQMLEKFCDSLGVSLPVPDMTGVIRSTLNAITDSDESGRVVSSVDMFVSELSALAATNKLRPAAHFFTVENEDIPAEDRARLTPEERANGIGQLLLLRLNACHMAYTEDRKRRGLNDETNGLRSLIRMLKENSTDPEGYVIDHARIHVQSGGKKCQVVAIDPTRIPDAIDFSMPGKAAAGTAAWGGRTAFDSLSN